MISGRLSPIIFPNFVRPFLGGMSRIRFPKRVGERFQVLGLIFLLLGLVFGLTAILQYAIPSLWRDSFSFARSRPLHVFLVVQWIFCGGIGGVYAWLDRQTRWNEGRKSARWGSIHFVLHSGTSLLILIALLSGRYGGREYLEFPPVLGIGYFLSWLLFAAIFFNNAGHPRSWPVYAWMFATGIVAFLFSYIEAFSWLIPSVGGTVVRDLTIQWKSLGSMVGSWNMLIYGGGFFILERIDGNVGRGFQRDVFLVYLLGFLNLLFNWGHHIYPLPVAAVLRNIAYGVSMTELLLLARILWNFLRDARQARVHWNTEARRWIFAADAWVLLNLALAILLSIPALNAFTHGTHITVAHAMGATIGINTNLLFASLAFKPNAKDQPSNELRPVSWLLWSMQCLLLCFWTGLLLAGWLRIDAIRQQLTFAEMGLRLLPYYRYLGFAGWILGALVGFVGWRFLRALLKPVKSVKTESEPEKEMQVVTDNG